MTDVDGWRTPSEVAGLLGVRVATVRKWIHEGKLPASRTPSGRFLVSVDDLALLPVREDPSTAPRRRSAVSELIVRRMVEERGRQDE